MNYQTRKLTTVAMLCAVAYIAVFFARISIFPAASFLKYDPKDIVIAIGGFIYGPLAAFLISLIVSLVEMFTISGTGPIGMLMNMLSSSAFACTAAFVYKKWRKLPGAVIGLVCGCVCMVTVMLLWNYLITPIYMHTPRKVVAGMLIPVFLPFNLLKGGLNAAFTMLLYKPVVVALRKSGLVDHSKSAEKSRLNIGALLVAAAVAATCILHILSLKGVF